MRPSAGLGNGPGDPASKVFDPEKNLIFNPESGPDLKTLFIPVFPPGAGTRSAARNSTRNSARNPDFKIPNPETAPKPGNSASYSTKVQKSYIS